MGQALSKHMSSRREKARSKRRLIKHLEDTIEYIELLQEQLEHLDNTLYSQDEIYSDPDSKPEQVGKAHLGNRSTEINEERKALKQNISIKKIALDVTKQKCDSLNRDLSRLQKRKSELQRQNSNERRKLAELKQKLEANQFNRFQKGHPLDTWTVCSLPNLHFTKLPL